MKRPIAVFDSGLGGLSVVAQLREQLPGEDIVYFGDTARVPYGTKSRETVIHFAFELSEFLMQFDPKLMIVACNTASALAMDALKRRLSVPVIGVVEPGAKAAVQIAGTAPIAVLGTEATIGSGAYTTAIHALSPNCEIISQACPLFVPLAEEGRACDDRVVRVVTEEYLQPLLNHGVRAVVLGCTHYPLLRDAIAAVMGPEVGIVESGHETAIAVRQQLEVDSCLRGAAQGGTMRVFVSDNPDRFQRVGSRFLNHSIEHVEYVAPQRYVLGPIQAK